jgi:hypothetical protein
MDSRACFEHSQAMPRWAVISKGLDMNRLHCLLGAMLCFLAVESNAQDAYSPFSKLQQLRGSASISVQHFPGAPIYTDEQRGYRDPGQAMSPLFVQAQKFDPDNAINNGHVISRSGFGLLHLQGATSGISQPPPGSPDKHIDTTSHGQAEAGFSDGLTINAQGLTGRQGLAHATILIDSHLLATVGEPPLGDAAREAVFSRLWAVVEQNQVRLTPIEGESGSVLVVGPATNLLSLESFASERFASTTYHTNNGFVTLTDTPLQGKMAFEVTMPFVFGTMFGIEAHAGLITHVGVSPPALSPDDPRYLFPRKGDSAAWLDVSWGGIGSVELINPDDPANPDIGKRLAAAAPEPIDFSVASSSGIDYRHEVASVPEPGSLSMTLGGLMAIGVACRRRDQAVRGGKA